MFYHIIPRAGCKFILKIVFRQNKVSKKFRQHGNPRNSCTAECNFFTIIEIRPKSFTHF